MAVAVSVSPRFSAGIPEPLFRVGLVPFGYSFDVLDRNRFLVSISARDDKAVSFTLVQNWTLLKHD